MLLESSGWLDPSATLLVGVFAAVVSLIGAGISFWRAERSARLRSETALRVAEINKEATLEAIQLESELRTDDGTPGADDDDVSVDAVNALRRYFECVQQIDRLPSPPKMDLADELLRSSDMRAAAWRELQKRAYARRETAGDLRERAKSIVPRMRSSKARKLYEAALQSIMSYEELAKKSGQNRERCDEAGEKLAAFVQEQARVSTLDN